MNNRMLDLWAVMEARNDMGIAKLLYDPSLPYHIYATYASDERGYGISFTFPDSIRIDTAPFPQHSSATRSRPFVWATAKSARSTLSVPKQNCLVF